MTILFAGGEMGAFIPSDGNAEESTSAPHESFSRCAISVATPTSYVESASFAAQDELWVHFALTDGAGSLDDAPSAMVLCNAAGTNLFRVVWNSSNSVYMQAWDGASWDTVGTPITVALGFSLTHLDLYVDGNSATGNAALYLSGTERITATSVDLSLVTAITKVRSYGTSSVSSTALSQVVVDTESTIGNRLTTAPATGAGATTDWTGTYAEIDEAICSDADFINSATNGQVELFSHGTAIPSGYRVRAVVVTARCKRGSSGPANLQLALRSAGTTYLTSSKAVGLGYGAFVGIWEDDPATAAPFTASAIAALQFGVKAIT